MKDKRIPASNYILVFSLLAVTGFEYFYRIGSYLLFVLCFYAACLFFKKFRSIDRGIVIVTVLAFILGVFQVLFADAPAPTFIVIPVTLLTAYFIARVVDDHFFYCLDKILYVLAIVSIVFFFLTYSSAFIELIHTKISPLFKPLSYNTENEEAWLVHHNIVIYNFKNFTPLYNRNSGPFWEPGMYVIFLNIIFFYHLFLTKKFPLRKKIVYLVAILTTFSSTGYIALIFIYLAYSLFVSRSNLSVLYILLLLAVIPLVFQLDFMESKITAQLNEAEAKDSSRFGAVLLHLRVLSDYPLFGIGTGNMYKVYEYTDARSVANGLSLVFMCFGIPLGLLYYILFYRSCARTMHIYSHKKYLGWIYFLLLLILTFSQDISVRIFYFFLIIWGFTVNMKQTNQHG